MTILAITLQDAIDETQVVELQLGNYVMGNQGIQGPPGPTGDVTPEAEQARDDAQAAAADAAASAAAAAATLTSALLKANNLSDLANAATARTNLGLGSMATQGASAVAVTGGAINGTPIGSTTAATGRFTTVDSSDTTQSTLPTNGAMHTAGGLGVEKDIRCGGTYAGQAAVTGGSVNSTPVGNTTPSTGAFTTLSTTGAATLNSGTVGGSNLVSETAAQTLTNKTLTSPTVNNPTISGGTTNNNVIGGTTPAAGTFTTLRANSHAKVRANAPASQSVLTANITDITNWVELQDTGNNFNPVTGVFTAPRAGSYLVTASISFNSASWSASGTASTVLAKNGSIVTQTIWSSQVTASLAAFVPMLSHVIDCAAGDTLKIQTFQNSGGTLTTVNASTNNTLSITELP